MRNRGTITCRSTAHRRGAAMIEFVLVIPLLALIIAITFFFGWSLMNKQHVAVSDRYTAWREVLTGSQVTGRNLNVMFFRDRAVDVDIHRGDGPDETLSDLAAAAGYVSAGAETLARETAVERFPLGRAVNVAAEFPTQGGIWRQFTGAIHSTHARDGVQWRRGQASNQRVVAREFLGQVDDALGGIAAPGTKIGQFFRRLYLAGW